MPPDLTFEERRRIVLVRLRMNKGYGPDEVELVESMLDEHNLETWERVFDDPKVEQICISILNWRLKNPELTKRWSQLP